MTNYLSSSRLHKYSHFLAWPINCETCTKMFHSTNCSNTGKLGSIRISSHWFEIVSTKYQFWKFNSDKFNWPCFSWIFPFSHKCWSMGKFRNWFQNKRVCLISYNENPKQKSSHYNCVKNLIKNGGPCFHLSVHSNTFSNMLFKSMLINLRMAKIG